MDKRSFFSSIYALKSFKNCSNYSRLIIQISIAWIWKYIPNIYKVASPKIRADTQVHEATKIEPVLWRISILRYFLTLP